MRTPGRAPSPRARTRRAARAHSTTTDAVGRRGPDRFRLRPPTRHSALPLSEGCGTPQRLPAASRSGRAPAVSSARRFAVASPSGCERHAAIGPALGVRPQQSRLRPTCGACIAKACGLAGRQLAIKVLRRPRFDESGQAVVEVARVSAARCGGPVSCSVGARRRRDGRGRRRGSARAQSGAARASRVRRTSWIRCDMGVSLVGGVSGARARARGGDGLVQASMWAWPSVRATDTRWRPSRT